MSHKPKSVDKRWQPMEATAINSETDVFENTEVFVDEKFVIKVGDLWFNLLTPFTLVEKKKDAAVLNADNARAQSHRILHIKKLQNEIVPV